MKKFAFILILAAAFSSCTVHKDDTRERTAENIAILGNSICGIVGDDIVVKLSRTIRDSSKYLFRDGLDTTLKTDAYGTRIKVSCTTAADSVLSVRQEGDAGVISFTAILALTGRDKDGQPLWKWTGNGKYDEKDSYSTLFESDAQGLSYLWTKYYYIYEYGGVDSVYVAAKTGKFRITNYYGNEELDWMELTYKGKNGYIYNGSLHD